ncbi:MAG: ABC transporter permease subunit [Vampirovibrionales bacterium]
MTLLKRFSLHRLLGKKLLKEQSLPYPQLIRGICIVWLALWIVGGLGIDGNALHPTYTLTPPFAPLWHQEPSLPLMAWLGTDDLGRSLWGRLGTGTLLSVGLGVGSVAMGWGIGVPFGLAWGAGYTTWWGKLIQGILQVWDTVPSLLWLLLASMLWSQLQSMPWLQALVMGSMIGLLHASDIARLMAQSVREAQSTTAYEAFESLGGTPWRFAWRYSLPHGIPRLKPYSRVLLMRSILAESTLSFVGLGLQPPISTLGVLANDAWQLSLLTIMPFLLVTSVLVAVMSLLQTEHEVSA